MTYSKDKWVAAINKAIADLKAKPSAGKVCAVATLRYVRDGLVDDICGADLSKASKDDKAIAETVKECINELIKIVSTGTEDGFASNASAAAKAAGHKTEATALASALEE